MLARTNWRLTCLALMMALGIASANSGDRPEPKAIGLNVKCYRIAAPMPDVVMRTLQQYFDSNHLAGLSAAKGLRATASGLDWDGSDLSAKSGITSAESTTPATSMAPFVSATNGTKSFLTPRANGKYSIETDAYEWRISVSPLSTGQFEANSGSVGVQIESYAPCVREELPGVSLPVGRPAIALSSAVNEQITITDGKWNAYLIYEPDAPDGPQYALVFVQTVPIETEVIPHEESTPLALYTAEFKVLRYPYDEDKAFPVLPPADSQVKPISGRAEFIPSLSEVPESEDAEVISAPRLTLSVWEKTLARVNGIRSELDRLRDEKFWKLIAGRPVINQFITETRFGGATDNESPGAISKPALIVDIVPVQPLDGAEKVGSSAWQLSTIGSSGIYIGVCINKDTDNADTGELDIAFSLVTQHSIPIRKKGRLQKTEQRAFLYPREFRFVTPVAFEHPFGYSYVDDLTGDLILIWAKVSIANNQLETPNQALQSGSDISHP